MPISVLQKIAPGRTWGQSPKLLVHYDLPLVNEELFATAGRPYIFNSLPIGGLVAGCCVYEMGRI